MASPKIGQKAQARGITYKVKQLSNEQIIDKLTGDVSGRDKVNLLNEATRRGLEI